MPWQTGRVTIVVMSATTRQTEAPPHVLVAYATKHGSTCEVADTVSSILRERQVHVDLRPAAEVDSLASYDAVVVGAALYMGRLHGDARRLLDRHRQALTAVPVAVFAMGPKSLADEDVAGARLQLERGLARFPEVEPVTTAIFGGVVDPAKLRFPLNRLPASDARDWDAIRTWANEVASAIADRRASAA
jgi:menaquinone-dependent protoporphyrinogen oxidase